MYIYEYFLIMNVSFYHKPVFVVSCTCICFITYMYIFCHAQVCHHERVYTLPSTNTSHIHVYTLICTGVSSLTCKYFAGHVVTFVDIFCHVQMGHHIHVYILPCIVSRHEHVYTLLCTGVSS